MQNLQYPIGKFSPPVSINKLDLGIAIMEIERLPKMLQKEVGSLDNDQLDTPYRSGGWTVRQLVHHLAESHMNSYIRVKWALTEKTPTIKAYDQKAWTDLDDDKNAPVEISLSLLMSLHAKWVYLLKNLSHSQWERSFIHPESGKIHKLNTAILNYAWHGKHHLAHITGLKERNGW